MYRVTLTYMGCVREVFTCQRLFVGRYGSNEARIFRDGFDTGWMLDGNTRIEVEPAEENA